MTQLQLRPILRADESGGGAAPFGLVYSAFRGDCEMGAKHLQTRCNIPCDYFHGGMIDSQKEDVLDNVFDRQVRHYDVLNCTVAFGLGMDIPGTKYVIGDSVPLSKAELIQLSGRAGRDPSKVAKYTLLASPARWARQYSLVHDSPELVVQLSECILMALDFTQCAHAKLGMWPSELINSHSRNAGLMGPTCESRCTACVEGWSGGARPGGCTVQVQALARKLVGTQSKDSRGVVGGVVDNGHTPTFAAICRAYVLEHQRDADFIDVTYVPVAVLLVIAHGYFEPAAATGGAKVVAFKPSSYRLLRLLYEKEEVEWWLPKF